MLIQSWPPTMDGEPALVVDVLMRNELAGRQCYYTHQLEQQWRNLTHSRFSVATVSGTAALTLAFRALEAEPGDEAIVPELTFVATGLAALHAGLIPRFCDVRSDTYTLDVNSARALLTDRTRAIVPVHLNGVPADMDHISDFAHFHQLAIIEDACQAHGAQWRGQPVGGLGFASAFSFNSSKGVPAGEGGMFVTSDQAAFEQALSAFQFGELPFTGPSDRTYHSQRMGWMFRPTEFVTALANHRTKYLDSWNSERLANHAALSHALEDVDGIAIQHVPHDALPAFWRYAFSLVGPLEDHPDVRDQIIKALEEAAIATSRWQTRALPDHQVFTDGFGNGWPWSQYACPSPSNADTPIARSLARNLIWLNDVIAPGNGTEEVNYAADVIRNAVIRHV